MATGELFESEPRDLVLAPGAVVLGGFARPDEAELVDAVRRVTALAPFRHMLTPGGKRMSAAMSNCGAFGWVTDRAGYRYASEDPQSGHAWPAMPEAVFRLAVAAAARAGFPGFAPDACLINRYEPGARLTLHQDKDERDYQRRSFRSRWACRPSSCSEAIAAPTASRPSGWFTATWRCGADPHGCAITASGRSRTACTRCSAASGST